MLADLNRKVLAADILGMPVLPSVEEKEEEISDRGRNKLKVEFITILRKLNLGQYMRGLSSKLRKIKNYECCDNIGCGAS